MVRFQGFHKRSYPKRVTLFLRWYVTIFASPVHGKKFCHRMEKVNKKAFKVDFFSMGMIKVKGKRLVGAVFKFDADGRFIFDFLK